MSQATNVINKLVVTTKEDDLCIYGEMPPELLKFTHKTFEKLKGTRFFPRDYHNIIVLLNELGVRYSNKIELNAAIHENAVFSHNFALYEFQRESVVAWNKYKSGTVILPTGSGKSIVALEIVYQLRLRSLIIVPTLVLFDHWKAKIQQFLSLDDDQIGFFGGGKKEIRTITIITYDSACLYVKQLGDKFGLIILDEAHHIGGVSYQTIVDGYYARYRLAITATLDKKEISYDTLMKGGFGPVVFEQSVSQLKEGQTSVISDYDIVQIKVDMAKIDEYKSHIDVLQTYIRSRKLRGDVFKKIVFMVNRDPEAERALLSYHKAKKISFAATEKIEVIREMLKKHEKDKIIIFCDLVDFCESISREFLIPSMTFKTSKTERKYVMEYFHNFDQAKIVTSTILDEGVDIPDINIGIIIAGSGKPRQFIQRLGRLLRVTKGKKKAILYEVLSIDTMEITAAKKRKTKL